MKSGDKTITTPIHKRPAHWKTIHQKATDKIDFMAQNVYRGQNYSLFDRTPSDEDAIFGNLLGALNAFHSRDL